MKVISLHNLAYRWSWCFKVLFYVAIFVGCYMAFTPVNRTLQASFSDKFLHVIGFVIMALCAHLAHPKSKRIYIFLGLVIFGLATEIVQAYLPYRSFSYQDWAYDVLGAFTYFLLLSHFLIDKSARD